MSRQSDSAKLLAIGLLNLADDEGYFYADPKMVRNAIRPQDDDSGITTVALRELSEIGYIDQRIHASHGAIGKIVSFTDHQVINKPSTSKIKGFFDSGSPTVVLPNDYHPEGKGKEGNKEGKGTPKPPEGDSGELFEDPQKAPPKDPSPPQTKNLPTSPTAIRIHKLFGRRDSTGWSDKEIRAFKKLGAISGEDLEAVCEYTEAERKKGESGRHRRDLLTFLNNFGGEVDRARTSQDGGQIDPLTQTMIDRVNSLNPSWQTCPSFTRAEMETLHANAKIFADLTESDWRLLTAYMEAIIPDELRATNPKDFWQPDHRRGLLEHVSSILSNADRWIRELKRRKLPIHQILPNAEAIRPARINPQ